jgi:hypothetical protein
LRGLRCCKYDSSGTLNNPADVPRKNSSVQAHQKPPVTAAVDSNSLTGTVNSKSELSATPNAPSGRMPSST